MKSEHLLIIIDLQKGFITPCSSHLVPALNLIQEKFSKVVFTKFHNPDPSPFRAILDYQKLSPASADTALALMPRRDALIIDRPYYTCVTSELADYLKKMDAREVYVTGIATEACVLKSVLDLFERNIRPLVVEDLCASDQAKHYHNVAIELMAKLIGKDQIIRQKDLPLA